MSDGSGFLDKILSLIGRSADPEKEKKRLLKEIDKQLKKSKFKFYKPKSVEALSAMAKFFYDIYRVVGPAKLLLDHAESSVVLKTIIIENSLNEKQVEIRDSFDESAIRETIKQNNGNIKAVADELKNNLVNFFSFFDTAKVKSINSTYNLMSVFIDFISFDFYFFLRKFDSRFPENDFNYSPRFEDINGEYVSEDLKDFLTLIPFLELDADWNNLFDVLSAYKGAEVLNRSEWTKQLRKLRDIRTSKVFELIIKSIDRNPSYSYQVSRPANRIVEDYLTKLKSQAELIIQKIMKEQQKSKLDDLAFKVFGTSAVSRMNHYTEKANLAFEKKMLGGFIYIAPMNYLKAFLVDYCKKDIREVSDVLIIRGKWTTNINSQQLSEAFYGLMAVADEVVKFDESLSEEGAKGAELSKLLKRRDADNSHIAKLRKELKDVNQEAARMINATGLHLIALAKSLKMVIEDFHKKPHELITNWKEIENAMDGLVDERLSAIYKKSYYFVQLLQHYSKKK